MFSNYIMNNTNYGISSLANNTTGKNNSAFGAYALYHNTALGAGSMCNNKTGSLNTAVGSSALEGNTSNTTVGLQNVAIGAQALFSHQSGDGNTSVGTYSMRDCVDGSLNTVVGFRAGENMSGNTNSNVLIGAYAGQSNASISNTIILNASGTTLNTTTSGFFV